MTVMRAGQHAPVFSPPAGSHVAYLLVLAAAFTSSWTGVYAGPLKLVDNLLLAAAIVGMVTIVTDFARPPRWVTTALVAAVLVLVLTLVFPPEPQYIASRFAFDTPSSPTGPESSINSAIQWFITLAALPVIVSNIVLKSGRPVTPILYAFAAGTCVSSLIAITDFAGFTGIGSQLIEVTAEQAGRQNGLASHVNNLGFPAAMGTIVALFIIRKGRRAVGAGMLVLLLAGTLLSGSRAAQAGALVSIVLAVLLVRELRPLLAPMLYVTTWLAVLLALVRSRLTEQFSNVLRFGADSGAKQSNEGRGIIALQAIEDFAHSPVHGIGYGALTGAHSIYLQVLATGGVILVVAMGVYWWGCIRDAYTAARSGVEVAGALLAVVGVWLLCGIVENMLVERYLYFVVACVVAVSLRLRRAPTDRLQLWVTRGKLS